MRAEDFLDGKVDSSSGLGSAEDFLGGTTPKKQNKGIMSDIGTAFTEGAKSAGRAVAGAANIYTGDEAGLVEKAKAQEASQADKPEALNAFYKAFEDRVKPHGEDIGLWDAVKAGGAAVAEQPKGAGLAVVEQVPNSVPALGGGLAGMKGGAMLGAPLGPVGAAVGGVVGGVAGMFLGNAAIETGYKGIEAAQDGAVTPEEMSQVKKEGAVKAGVITGVDALTLGLSKAVTNIPARAVESATRRALTNAGVDVTNEAAVLAARQSPEVSTAVRAAQEAAFASANTIGKRAAAGGTALALETVGEGLGEYLGELAATGKANVADAVLEAMLSLGQSGAEVAWGAMRNKKTEQGGIWDAAEEKYQPPTPTLITEPAPLQQRIDDLMGINTDAMSDAERKQYESDLVAAFLEPVGVTQDENGIEVPFTMADYLNSQVNAEDTVRARPLRQQAGQAADARLQQLAEEEATTQPDIPAIPVVGPLSAAANVAVQTGAAVPPTSIMAGLPGAVAVQPSQQEASNAAALDEGSNQGQGNNQAGSAGVARSGGSVSGGILSGAGASGSGMRTDSALGNAGANGIGALNGLSGTQQVATQAPQAAGPQAGAQQAAAPQGQVAGPDVSGRTDKQLDHLVSNGSTQEVRAAARAEIAKRKGSSVKDAPSADAAPAAKASTLSVGAAPGSADPITVKDGVVYIGNYPAQNFDTGEDVTVSPSATPQQIVFALKDSGAISPKQKLFGLEATAPEDVIGWTQMTAAQREGLVYRAGYAGANGKLNLAGVRIVKTAWASMSQQVRDKLIAASQMPTKVADQPSAETVTAPAEAEASNSADKLPSGWSESAPGGMATNNNPETGGIVDQQVVGGKWFAVANKDGVGTLEGFDTRAEALAALANAVSSNEIKLDASKPVGVFKKGDEIRIRGEDDKVHTVESVGPDGWVYLMSGGAFPPEKIGLLYHTTGARKQGVGFPGFAPVEGEEAQPKTDTARKPLHKFENKETGMASMVVEGAKPGLFNVVLRDEDSGEYVPIAVTGFDSVEKAIARAKYVVGLESENNAAPEAKQDKAPAATPQHIEKGEAEAATAPVVAQALKKGAANSSLDLREQRELLLKKIDAAIAAAPTAAEKDAWDSINQKIDLKNNMRVEESIGYRVFEVPGDGKFKILNLKEALQRFRDRVEANPGFKKPANTTGLQKVAPWQRTTTGGTEAVTKELLEAGEYSAAVEYAKQIDKPLIFGQYQNGSAITVYTEAKPFEREGYDDFRMVSARNPQGGDKVAWAVIDLGSGLTISSNHPSRLKAIAETNKALAKMTPEQLATAVKSAKANTPGLVGTQEELEQRWLTNVDQREADAQGRAEQEHRKGLRSHRGMLADATGKTVEEAGKTAAKPAEEPKVDYKGFERIATSNGAFELRDGNMTVKVEPTTKGKYQASFRSAKSSPHLVGEQGAVDWAASYRNDAMTQKPAENAKPTDNAKREEFTHNGVRIYPANVNVGGEAKAMWGVESFESKAKREAGERHGFGDGLFDTEAQAKEAADRLVADAKSKAEYDASVREKEADAARNKAAVDADTFNGFLDDKAPNVKALTRERLAKQWRFAGDKVMTARERIESLWKAGELSVSTYEEDKIKPMSRTQFNRATQREQDAHEKKVREGGKVTVYQVNGSDLGKTAYDYASHLIGINENTKPAKAADQSPAADSKKQEEAKPAEPTAKAPTAAEKRKTLDESLRAGSISVDDYMNAVGLTDDDIGFLSANSLREQAGRIAKERSPYHQAINKVHAALSEQMQKAMDSARNGPQQRKSREERIARITRDRETLDMLARKYEHPFKNDYVSKLSDGLRTRFASAFDKIKTGPHARDEFNNDSYGAWAELLIEAANKKQGTEPTKPAEDGKAEGKAEAIGDFGEKIGGAKKDIWTGYKDKLADAESVDIKAEPLSKSWPAPDYEALIESGVDPFVVAFVRAARDSIPRKPVATWKLKSWAGGVELLRDTSKKLIDGDLSEAKAKELLQSAASVSRGMRDIAGRIELYQLVGHRQSLDGISLSNHFYSLYKGKENVNLWAVEKEAKATAFSNMPAEIVTGSTKQEVLDKFKALYDKVDFNKKAERSVTFDLYTQGGKFYIGKKMGRNITQLAGPFDTIKETRAYRNDNQDELVSRLEKSKEIPKPRRDKNEPRVGEDMRDGQDVTPEMFAEAFGFKGVEFGNWVEQKKRQKDLNDSYDALMDMAAILNIPPKALSLNGQLGLAFGARGAGGIDPAAAHYERDFVVINLTKKEGAGSLGHEWFHALDNYFSRLRGKNADMITEALDVSLASRGSEFAANTSVRKEIIGAFGNVVRAIKATALRERSARLDNKRSKAYWTTTPEMSARAFESYLISKLQDQNASNDYLANIVDPQTWKAAESLGFELDNSYPYPTAGEMPLIREAFEKFFQTVETKETDSGVMLYNIAAPSTISPADKAIYGMAAEGKSATDILKFIASASRSPFNRQVAKLLLKTGIVPKVMVSDSKGWKFNAGEGNKYAAAYNPTTDTVALFRPAAAERNMLHELVHAATIKALSGKGMAAAQMNALYKHVKKTGKLKGMYGMSDIDEFIAEAFTNPKFQEKLKSVSAPSGGNKLATAWDWFIRVVRGILGLPANQDSALSRALEIGVGVMREDMKLRNNDAGVPFAEITGKEVERTLGRNLQEKARNWMKANLQGKSFRNDATGWDISVGRKGVSKTMMHAAKDVHAKSVAAIPSLLKNAVLVSSEENKNAIERKAIPIVHHLYAPLLLDGNKYIARLVIKEATDGTRFYDFDTSDEISPANSAISGRLPKEEPASGPSLSKQGGTVPSARLNMSMSELLSYVKAEHGGTDPRFVRYNVADDGWSVAEQAKEAVMRLAGRPMLDPSDPFAAENARLREQDQSLWSKAKKQLRRYLAPGGLLPQSVFAEKIKRDSEFQAVEFDIRHLIGGLEQAVKADYGMAFDKLSNEQMRPITEALAGNVPASLPEATKTAAIAMRQYIDGMSTEYLKIIQEKIDAKMLKALESGKDADKAQAINDIELFEKIKGNIGRYVHRSYQAFDDPKWFEKVPAPVLNASRLYLKQGYLEAGETDAKAAQLAEVTLHEILKNGTAYDSMESFIAESKLGAKDLSVLMRRKEVPAQIRALLGEYPDARLNFTKSATKMGRLIWNTRFLERVRDIGMGSFFFDGKDRPPAATTQIAADGSEVYAPLNGLWTFPEIAQAFKDALGKEQMSDLYRAIVRANGIVKYGKTVLSPTTAMRNWQSAMFFSLANGHFDLTQMKKSISAFREQVSQKATGGDLKYLRHLKQLGVVYDTPYAGEMARLMEDARMEELLSSEKGDAVRWFRKANQMAQGFYTFGDDFWKIIGFENEKAGLMKAGLTPQEAEVEAAKRIRDTYPTYSMVGRGIQWLSRFPLAGTFVSFPAEIVRTSGNMLRTVAADLKSDNPKLRELGMRRAAGMVFVSSAFYGLAALSMAMAGVGDDEDEAIRDLAPEWQKNSTFLYLGRDEKGNLRYFDLSFLDPYGYWKRPLTAMMRNQPWEDSLASGLRGMLEPFLGTDIAAGAIFEAVANQKESGGKVYKEKDSAIDQTIDIADHLRKALQPGFVGNAERLVKAAADVRRSSGQPYSMEDEIVALAGWRASTVDTKTALYYRSFEFTDAIAEARKTVADTLRNANSVSAEDIADAKMRGQAKQDQAFKQMSRLVGAAEAAGLSKMQIIQTLRLSNISQANIAYLMRGSVPDVSITPQMALKAFKQANEMRGREFADEVLSRYRQAMAN